MQDYFLKVLIGYLWDCRKEPGNDISALNLLDIKKIRNFTASIKLKHKVYNAAKKNEQSDNYIRSKHEML